MRRTHVRIVMPVVALTAVGCSSSGSSGSSPNNSGSNSTNSTPATMAASCDHAMSSEATFLGGTPQPGTWGTLPAALQQLPPHSTLCGAIVPKSGGPTVVISTSASVQDLEAFYQPLLTNNGCTVSAPEMIDPVTNVSFKCNGKDGTYTYAPSDGFYRFYLAP